MRKQTLTFALSSACILLIAGMGISYMHRYYTVAQLGVMAERNNIAVTRVLTNAVLPDFADYLAATTSMSPKDIAQNPTTLRLRRRVLAMMNASSIIGVELYDRHHRRIFSTDPDEIGGTDSDDLALRQAWAGQVISRLVWAGQPSKSGTGVEDRSIVSSLVPVDYPQVPGHILVVVGLSTDVTRSLVSLDIFHRDIMMVVWLALLSIYGGLVWMVWRSNRAADKHHAQTLRLAAAVARSEAANQSKNDFLATMSHELRTPLNAIIGFSEMMMGEMLGPIINAAYRDYAGNIHESGLHLLAIVNDILDMAKAEDGNVSLETERFDLAEALRQTVTTVSERANSAGLTLEVEIGDRLGSIVSDKRRLRQILLNLLSNAIKFTPSGGIVSIRARRVLDKAAIEIADTGIGIAEEEMPMALTPFGQIDSSLSRKHEGVGLGLPLAKKITELLSGTFHIESRLGEGTRVTLTFPAGVSDELLLAGQPVEPMRRIAV